MLLEAAAPPQTAAATKRRVSHSWQQHISLMLDSNTLCAAVALTVTIRPFRVAVAGGHATITYTIHETARAINMQSRRDIDIHYGLSMHSFLRFYYASFCHMRLRKRQTCG